MEACTVSNVCIVLAPQLDDRAVEERLADMFLHAALITSNSWHFDYERTCTRERIAELPLQDAMSISPEGRAKLVKIIIYWLQQHAAATATYAAD
jgi:hypothetical protein